MSDRSKEYIPEPGDCPTCGGTGWCPCYECQILKKNRQPCTDCNGTGERKEKQ